MFKYLFAVFVVCAGPAFADEKLPWFGGEDQVAFQITTDGRVMTVQLPVAEEAEVAEACTIESCFRSPSSARVPVASGISP